MRTRLSHAAAALTLASAVAAQGAPGGGTAPGAPAAAASRKLAWRVPKNGFVEFTRERTKFGFDGDHRILRPNPDPAPGFYERELEDGKTVTYPSAGLPDLIPQLACSLSGWAPRKGQKAKSARKFERVHKFGAVRATGTTVTLDAADPARVVESGSFALERIAPAAEFAVARNWPPLQLAGEFELGEATITFTRTVDTVAGQVVEFEAQLAGSMQRREDAPARRRGARQPEGDGDTRTWRFDVQERWKLAAVHAPRDRGFDARVNDAIAKGCKFLEGKIDAWFRNEVFRGDAVNERSYGAGRLALVLLTLITGNPDREAPAIRRLLEELRGYQPIDTYSLGVALMALEGYYAPANEAEQIREGLIEAPARRTVSAADKEIMQRWVRQLLENRDTRVDRGYRLRFNYVAGARFDNSVTQYGVLGLYSAALCGIEIPISVWLGLAEHYVESAGRPELEGRLRLTTYGALHREQRNAAGPGATVARGRIAAVEARGWGYVQPTEPTGSMTCAGLTGAGVCHAMIAGSPVRRAQGKLLSTLEDCRLSGFEWLRQNYDVRDNPRRNRDFFYYYLYGLERACEINGVARIHDYDWYWDGAMQLLATQARSGQWGSLDETCFAILFLKKAVTPPVTGR